MYPGFRSIYTMPVDFKKFGHYKKLSTINNKFPVQKKYSFFLNVI